MCEKYSYLMREILFGTSRLPTNLLLNFSNLVIAFLNFNCFVTSRFAANNYYIN